MERPEITQQNGNHSIEVKFPGLSLDDLKGELRDMTPREQRKQISPPFAINGIYFVVAIEKLNENENPKLGGIDVSVGIFCVSVPVRPRHQGKIPLKDKIRLGENVFDSKRGQAFNLLGKPYPAYAVEMLGHVKLTLESGKTKASTEMNFQCENDIFGGYYNGTCYGFWATLLDNHRCNAKHVGKNIFVTVDFHGDLPIALFKKN